MALTQQQITGLNAAAARQAQGSANADDLKNLAYAKTQGYSAPAAQAPVRPPTTSTPTAPALSTPVSAPKPPQVTSTPTPTAPVVNSPVRPPTTPTTSSTYTPPPTSSPTYTPPTNTQQTNTQSNQSSDPYFYTPTEPIPAGYDKLDIKWASDFEKLKATSDYENIRAVGNPDHGGYYIAYKIPTAVVIGPNGERVKVRTDNKTGTYRTEAEMLAQGFQKESAPGVAANGSTPGNTAMSVGNRPTLITAYGQTVSPTDPNYSAYENSPGVRKATTAPPSETPQQTMDRIRAQQNAIQGAGGQYISPQLQAADGRPLNETYTPPPSSPSTFTDADFGYTPPTPTTTTPGSDLVAGAYDYNPSDPYSAQRAALDALIAQINGAGTLSPEEQQLQDLQAQMRSQDLSTQMGIANVSDQPIAATFLQGQSAALQRQGAIKNQGLTNQAETLQSRVATVQQKRQAAIDAAKLKLQYETDAADRAAQQAQQRTTASRPIEVGGNLVDPSTGKVVYQGAVKATEPIVQKLGDTLYERQTDGSWREVASSPTSTNKETQIVNVGGRQLLVDKNTGETIRDLGQAGSGGIGDLTPAQQTAAFKLVDDYEKASGSLPKVISNYNNITAAASNPSAAGDISLIFAYMKMLDPNSVVREGEFATAQNAAGIPTQIQNIWNKSINGERLSAAQRTDFLSQSKTLYDSAISQQRQIDATFTERANRFGVPPDLVIRDQYAYQGANPTAPGSDTATSKPVTIEDLQNSVGQSLGEAKRAKFNDIVSQNPGITLEDIRFVMGFSPESQTSLNGASKETSAIVAVKPQDAWGGQCGEFVHSLVSNYPYGLNSFEEKKGVINVKPTETPKVGDVVVQKIGGGSGHVAVINSVDIKNGTATLTESNYYDKSKPEKVTHTRTVALNDPSIAGYFRGKLKV